VQRRPQILLVDCEHSFTDTARLAFETGFRLVCVTTEEEALRKVKKEAPDIIILGYLEPRGASRQLASRLAADGTTARIPVLVVDVKPDEYAHKGWRWSDGFSDNVKGYVWRPIDAIELKKTAEGVLQRTRAGTMNLTDVAEQTEEMVKRIEQLKRLLGSETQS
jgi:DNA-binding response OmpR family regulator